ncbi:MAG: hypothetical protein IPK08_17910 [Bacteroidetes bacterium]|nr:hypothetical protein [Bacteroidota bacterium]
MKHAETPEEQVTAWSNISESMVILVNLIVAGTQVSKYLGLQLNQIRIYYCVVHICI